MEWFKKWLTDGFTKVPLLSISINLKFFKKYGTKYSCTCRVNKLFKNDWLWVLVDILLILSKGLNIYLNYTMLSDEFDW